MTVTPRVLTLGVLEASYAIVRMPPDTPTPAWAEGGAFLSITRTRDELSIIVESSRVPAAADAELRISTPWSILVVHGPIDFAVIGVTRDLVTPLAAAGISVLPVASFDTDHLLVPSAQLDEAIVALRTAGHVVHR